MSGPTKLPTDPGQPWLAWDERADTEDCICGNAAGLRALRTAIDEALEKGQARIEVPFSAFPGVMRIDGDPRESFKPSKLTVSSCLVGLLSFVIVSTIVCGGVALYIALTRYLAHLLPH